MVSPIVGCCVCLPIAAVFWLRWYITKTVKCPSHNRLDNKIVVVTGATSGIGKATATELARRGATVVLACRNRHKAEAVVTAIRKKTNNEKVQFLPLDVSSFQSVEEFTAVYRKLHGQHLDVLVNNAGYLGPQKQSADGFDLTFHTNALGPFLLTRLLCRGLEPEKSRPMRVINVVSDSYPLGKIDFDDLMYKKRHYTLYQAYASSKLALLLLTMEMNFRSGDRGVWVLAVHPGAVKSGLQQNWPGIFGKLLRLMASLLFRSPEDGCQSIVYAAVADDISQYLGGAMFDCKPWKLAPIARDYKTAEGLWQACNNLCGSQLPAGQNNNSL